MSKRWAIVMAAMLVGLALAIVRGHRQPGVVASGDQARAPDPAPEQAPDPPPSPPPRKLASHEARQIPARPAFPTEASLMTAIRDLGASNPARALELSREGNVRFPNTPDAAERSWTICKSLAALGRAAEAREEAREMVQQYPDTSWAGDVRRHLLSQPLDDPGQRGFGKSSELD